MSGQIIGNIQAISEEDIPDEIFEKWRKEEEAYETGLYTIDDDGSEFSEWMKQQGFVFNKDKDGASMFTWFALWM